MQIAAHAYRCRLCSATSYRRLVQRGQSGAMTYSGLYGCSGCDLTFTNHSTWRAGSSPANATAEADPNASEQGAAAGRAIDDLRTDTATW